MARWMLSLGMFSARAARMAARRRGFMFGSGSPILAATVISRASLEKTLERTASTLPLRCMMFLNCECPAIGASVQSWPRASGASEPRDDDGGLYGRPAPTQRLVQGRSRKQADEVGAAPIRQGR